MTLRGLVLIAAALGLAAATPVRADDMSRPLAASVTAKSTTPASKPAALEKPPPITFFVAKGDANACGVGCSEWIAADGTIDSGADDRLRALLKKLGGRQLPIYFHSPGGAVPTGLATGRLMRQRGLTAGVGWTVPAGCDAKQQQEAACDRLKRSGRDLVAVLDTGHGMCNSACVYALVGAAVREVGAGVGLGVHSSSISFTLKRIDADGHVTRMATHGTPTLERKALEGGYATTFAYLREMGISQDLLAAARAVDNSRVRFLTRDELVAFGIDRREVVEGMWLFAEQAFAASAVKIIEEKRAGAFRKDIVSLSCRGASALWLEYSRERDASAGGWPVPMRVTTSGGSFLLSNPSRFASGGGFVAMEVRSVELPISVLGDATLTIESAQAAGLTAKVTVQPAGPGLAELARRCGNDPPKAKGVPAERI